MTTFNECKRCGGTGTKSVYLGNMGGSVDCPNCNGDGEVMDETGKPSQELIDTIRGKRSVHENEIRELVDDWREKADTLYEIYERTGDESVLGEVTQVELLADELVELIEE